MTDYQPGRIYSGIVLGKRVHLICRPNEAVYPWSDGMHCLLNCDVADVRGPLVVLDLTNYGYSEALPRIHREAMNHD